MFPGESFEERVEALNPGDTLIIHEGTYADTGRISITAQGTESAPILIKGADGEQPPLITRASSANVQNTINIEGASFVTLEGLEISSNGGDGVRLINNSSYITLENLHIHHIDVGINFRSDMHHIIVRHTHIHHTGAQGNTGEGLYVGCNFAKCVVQDTVIEWNWIHDTLAGSQGDGIEIKRGSHSNTIRDNVIYDTRYPCILLYGTDHHPVNVVERNVMWNCGDSGIQAAADALIQNNIIFGSHENGFNSQDHQGVTPANITFIHNTIIGGDPCLRLQNWKGKPHLVFANNAVYCPLNSFVISNLSGVKFSGNVIVPSPPFLQGQGALGDQPVDQAFLHWRGKNVYPSKNSALIDAGDPLLSTPNDFNGFRRNGTPDAGAYTWVGPHNPGWAVSPGFKELANKFSE